MNATQFKLFVKHCEDHCKITRKKESVDPFSTDDESESDYDVLYDGICDIQVPATIRTFTQNGVIKKDSAIYIPACVDVREGDVIDLTPKYNPAWTHVCVTKGITKDGLTTINVNIPTN